MRRREVLLGAMALGLSSAGRAQTSPSAVTDVSPGGLALPAETIDLWPGEAPGMPLQPLTEAIVERSSDARSMDRFVTGISRPRMAVFRPRAPNGSAILITPGGGYERVVIDKEGYEPARWLTARGFTAFVLFYRLPGDGWAAGPSVALSDAQRAVRLIRSLAGDHGIDPERVAAMGFSAGGHVCADLATRFATGTYDPVDTADELTARPRATALIYPVISMTSPIAHAGSREMLIGKEAGPELEFAHSPQHHVPADAPPCFLVHAEDDPSVAVQNTLEFRAALRARGIPVETHLFAQGGHGFGLRKVIDQPAGVWPDLFVNWSKSTGLI